MIALTAATPAVAASVIALSADLTVLTVTVGAVTFSKLVISGPPSSQLTLVLSGTTFDDATATRVVQSGADGTVAIVDIQVPDSASTGTLQASLVGDAGSAVTVSLVTTTPPGYDFVALSALIGSAYGSVTATFDIAGVPVSPGATLTIDYDRNSLNLMFVQANPRLLLSEPAPTSPTSTTFGDSIPTGRLEVTMYFLRMSGAPATVTVTAGFGSSPALGPVSRSVVAS